MQYRCPIDDCLFNTINLQGAPSANGHPECPGPHCREEFDGFPGAGPVTPLYQPNASAPVQSAAGTTQSWEEMRAAQKKTASGGGNGSGDAAGTDKQSTVAPSPLTSAGPPPVPRAPVW